MAGPRKSWLRCQFDYWKYYDHERFIILASCILLFISILSLSTLGPNSGYREWISWFVFIVSISLIGIDERAWKNKIKKIDVRNFKGPYKPSFAPNAIFFGGRAFVIFEDVNKAIRSRILRNKPVQTLEPYELHANAKKIAFLLLEYFHLGFFHGINGKRIKMWNDDKLRLHTSPESFTEKSAIELKKTSYFDYLGTAFFSLRECRYDNELLYDGESLMKHGNHLASITDSKTAHHIGVNALLITADKHILYQHTKAPAAPDKQVPSGSGSLDMADVDLSSFEKTLLNGALRELSEETGWNDIAEHGRNAMLQNVEDMFFWPLGMSVDLSRGMLTDFFFLVIAEKNPHYDYKDYYEDGKVKLDLHELKPVNSVDWAPLNTDNIESLKESIKRFFEKNVRSNSMLSISLDFLLKAIEEQEEVHNRIKTLLNMQ